MTSSLLEQELEPLDAQIGQVQKKLEALKGELCVAEAEAQTFYVDQQRFDALRDVCNAIDRLGELDAADFFWEGLSGSDVVGHLRRLRERIARFEVEIRGVLERQKSLKGQIWACFDQLDFLDEEVRQAHAREERRVDELVIEREISPVPYRQMIMPWSSDGESERRYRRAMLTALTLSISFSALLPFWKLPELDRSAPIEIPKRLAMLVKKEQEKPEPVKKSKEDKKEKKEEEKGKKEEEKKKEKREEGKQAKEQENPKEEGGKAAPAERVAGNKAQSSGVMKFKSSFKDLMDETPVARLGVDARLSNTAASAAGEAQASRSLVAMQTGGGSGSGGISNAGISRNLGSGSGNGIGIGRAGTGSGNGSGRAGTGSGNGSGRAGTGTGFARVESAIAGLAAKEGKPLSSKTGPVRTDEEIQILFDRYKAALYRIYNTELRKNPTLGGKMVLRLTIEPSGAVSACAVESSNMNATEFSAQIVDRVKKFNFGAKDGVPKTTILYPIDFLPAR